MPKKLKIKCEIVEGAETIRVRTRQNRSLVPYGIETKIPMGFESDGMSVPRFLWRWIGANIGAKTLSPSVAHDWLYTRKPVSRAFADAWYRRQLIAAGYPKAKAWAVWAGLRLFGASHWKP